MKKYFFLVLLIPAIWWALPGKGEKKTSSPVNLTSSTSSKKVFLGKREALPEKDQSTTENYNCNEASSFLDQVDFNYAQEEWSGDLDPEVFSSCSDPKLLEKIKDIQSTCFPKKENMDECMTNLVQLRALFRSQKIVEPRNREELADFILAEFSKNPPDFKKVAKFSKEMLAEMPEDPTLQKVWAMTHLVSQPDFSKLGPDFEQEIFAHVDPALLDKDSNLRDMKMIMKTGLEPLKIEAYALEELKHSPDDASTHEILGLAYWKQGRKQEALAALDRAIALSPNDEALKRMREDLKSPNANQSSYVGRLRLGVRLDDLFR